MLTCITLLDSVFEDNEKSLMSFKWKQPVSVQQAVKQSGAVGACWAHNPEVDGSKPSSAIFLFFFLHFCFITCDILGSHYHSNRVSSPNIEMCEGTRSYSAKTGTKADKCGVHTHFTVLSRQGRRLISVVYTHTS